MYHRAIYQYFWLATTNWFLSRENLLISFSQIASSWRGDLPINSERGYLKREYSSSPACRLSVFLRVHGFNWRSSCIQAPYPLSWLKANLQATWSAMAEEVSFLCYRFSYYFRLEIDRILIVGQRSLCLKLISWYCNPFVRRYSKFFDSSNHDHLPLW